MSDVLLVILRNGLKLLLIIFQNTWFAVSYKVQVIVISISLSYGQFHFISRIDHLSFPVARQFSLSVKRQTSFLHLAQVNVYPTLKKDEIQNISLKELLRNQNCFGGKW